MSRNVALLKDVVGSVLFQHDAKIKYMNFKCIEPEIPNSIQIPVSKPWGWEIVAQFKKIVFKGPNSFKFDFKSYTSLLLLKVIWSLSLTLLHLEQQLSLASLQWLKAQPPALGSWESLADNPQHWSLLPCPWHDLSPDFALKS